MYQLACEAVDAQLLNLNFRASRAIKYNDQIFHKFLPSKILHIFFIKYIISFNDRKT